ncbi:MAG: hotdog fold thioesterase, partial [Bacteroidetes bacterium]|nr:hotdog fold thioesterase [Bacteroidota bacterium]
MGKHTMVEGLGITFVPSAPGTFAATMPVDQRTKQPMGLLHGGATAALAETLGSMGSAMLIDLDKHAVVGIEVSANHLKGVKSGVVTATGTVLHKGRTMHVWDIRVHNEEGVLVAACRL